MIVQVDTEDLNVHEHVAKALFENDPKYSALLWQQAGNKTRRMFREDAKAALRSLERL